MDGLLDVAFGHGEPDGFTYMDSMVGQGVCHFIALVTHMGLDPVCLCARGPGIDGVAQKGGALDD